MIFRMWFCPSSLRDLDLVLRSGNASGPEVFFFTGVQDFVYRNHINLKKKRDAGQKL